MEQEINLNGQLVKYQIRQSRLAKRIRLTIRPDCLLTLTIPRRASIEAAERFMRDKAYWIIGKVDFFRKNAIYLPVEKGQYQKKKVDSERFVKERLNCYNRLYSFSWGRVSVKNHQRRWGSCSAKGNLNFNYRIASLPLELADYIIVHELCHLKEMNHSKRFWHLVAQTIPDFSLRRKKLKGIIF